MTLSRTEVVVGLVDELEAFGALIGPLDAAAWSAPHTLRGMDGGRRGRPRGRFDGRRGERPARGSWFARRSRPGKWPSARVGARPSWPPSWPR